MNIYAKADLFDGTQHPAMDASDFRRNTNSVPNNSVVGFTGYCGDDHSGLTANVFSIDGIFTVKAFEHHSNGGCTMSDLGAFKSLSVAMRVAHGWCIAD